MRIVIDLQACQGLNARRGIGRYSMELARALLRQAGAHELIFSLSGSLPDSVQDLAASLRALDPGARLALHGAFTGEANAGSELPEAELMAHWASLRPDVVHVSSVFEHEPGGVRVPRLRALAPPWLQSATLYDLIPALFPQRHLPDAASRASYFERLHTLRRYDLLLAISQSAGRDAHRVLGMPPEAVAVVGAAVSDFYGEAAAGTSALRPLAERLGLHKPFVLYTGGNDPRKNLSGLIGAFAMLEPTLRERHQLVLVMEIDAPSRQSLQQLAARHGLAADALVLTGYIPDGELRTLYRECALFVFPSLYEGFGLPVLEAMRCGAPVVAADNSSLPELVADPDARFDAENPAQMARTIARGLADADFRARLIEQGRATARRHSWDGVAAAALDAWTQRLPTAPSAGSAAGRTRARTKPRIAVVTPVPPQASGIAAYNEALLPHLATRFAIDVYSHDDEALPACTAGDLPVLDAATLWSRRHRYDAVLYHFGNSHFHGYMFELLERLPGIVVLHDAFLSGIVQYLDVTGAKPGFMPATVAACHALQDAVRADPAAQAGELVVRLPCSGDVVRKASAVVVYSRYARDLLVQHYGSRLPPIDVLAHLKPAAQVAPDARAAARAALRLDQADTVVATFGHIVWTKLPETLLEAFAAAARRVGSLRLVFVGQADAAAPLTERLTDAIARSGLAERVVITGYASAEQYERWLMAADLAVQLRASTRGESSGATLDCLAHGLPLIVNAHGSLGELPRDAVHMLDDPVEAAALEQAIVELAAAPERRRAQARAAHAYLTERHSPQRVTDDYVAVIDREIAWLRARNRLGNELGAATEPAPAARRTAAALWESDRRQLWHPRRLLIDVSFIARIDYRTGIQRVVWNICREIGSSTTHGYEVRLVRLDDEVLRFAPEVEAKLFAPSAALPQAQALAGDVAFRDGDTLLMLDSSWNLYAGFARTFARVRARAGRIATVVYDMLPAVEPDYFGGREAPMPTLFRDWIARAALESDALLCISRAVADTLRDYVDRWRLPHGLLRIGHFHLGADFARGTAASALPYPADAPVLLFVSTVEPRKGHETVLDAAQRLWDEGLRFRLVFVGRPGWGVEALVERLQAHSRLDTDLFWLREADDALIAAAYDAATAYLFPSKAEGFGLGLVEAALHGTPVICSDLAVFREIADGHARFVAVGDVDAWAGAMRAAVTDAAALPPSAGMPVLSWADSAQQLLAALDGARTGLQPDGTRPDLLAGVRARPESLFTLAAGLSASPDAPHHPPHP